MNGREGLNGLVLPSQEQVAAANFMRAQVMATLTAQIVAPLVAVEYAEQRKEKPVAEIVVPAQTMNLAGNVAQKIMQGCGL